MALGRDGIAGLILLGISLALLIQSFSLPQVPLVPVGPGFYPRIVLIFLASTSALLVAQDVLARRARAAAEGQGARLHKLVVAAFAIVAAYCFLLPPLGYRLATPLFVAGLQAALELPRTAKQWVWLVAVALGATVVTYLAFESYLLVLLPRGAWTGW